MVLNTLRDRKKRMLKKRAYGLVDN